MKGLEGGNGKGMMQLYYNDKNIIIIIINPCTSQIRIT